jgi:hypothetical protein
MTYPNDGDIKPNTKDCNKCNGEEKSVDREKRTGQWWTSLESKKYIRIPFFWISIHLAAGLAVSVCGANVRPNPFKGGGSC